MASDVIMYKENISSVALYISWETWLVEHVVEGRLFGQTIGQYVWFGLECLNTGLSKTKKNEKRKFQ